MAEQKAEDQKSPATRRGVRPFAGPGSAASPAKPFLRPAPAGARPTAAPFAPAVVPGRQALGTAPVSATPLPAVGAPPPSREAAAPAVEAALIPPPVHPGTSAPAATTGESIGASHGQARGPRPSTFPSG